MFNILETINNQSEGARSLLFSTVLVWSMFWKGLSLWHSARNKQKYWFVAILILNTVGIAEIIYLTFFKKDRNTKVKKVNKKIH